MFEFQNSKKQGDAGLAIAIAYFAMRGYTVSIPLTDSQDYDLIVDNGTVQKVQVKTTKSKQSSGNFEVGLRTLGGNQSWNGVSKFFDATTVDLLFIVTSENQLYCIPSEDLDVKSSLTLCKKYTKYLVSIN